MSAFALVTGRLHGDPRTQPTRTGGHVIFIKLKVTGGNAVTFWDVAVFDDAARAELEGLREGAALSVSGPFSAEIVEWNGEKRLRLRITADRILPLRQRAKASSGEVAA
jgi:hypothetical protein